MAANNEAAPNVMRLNLARGTREEIVARMTADGIGISSGDHLPETAVLESAADYDSDSYRAGLFHPQSEASQLVARMLAPSAGATVVDCAAAPGGKTTHLAELADARGRVVALDMNLHGLKAARDLARRLGHRNIVFATADLAAAPPLHLESAGFVLLDAPCTGTGTLREHPEIRWRLAADDFRRMAELQRAMLENAAALVRPGGVIVYAVCSVAPQEGPGVVRGFLAEHPEFALERPETQRNSRLGFKATGRCRPVPSAAASTAFSPPGCAGDERAFCRAAAEPVVFAHGTRAQDCAVDPVG